MRALRHRQARPFGCTAFDLILTLDRRPRGRAGVRVRHPAPRAVADRRLSARRRRWSGRNTPGFVADTRLAEQLAEVGVILLMFGVGCSSTSRSCWRSAGSRSRARSRRARSRPCSGAVLGRAFGWSWAAGGRVRHRAVGREHRRARPRPRRQQRPAHARPATSPSAGWSSRTCSPSSRSCCCRRCSAPRAAPDAASLARCSLTGAEGRRRWSPSPLSSGTRVIPCAARPRRRERARASCSR